jgi:molybdopterin molybdotransferase
MAGEPENQRITRLTPLDEVLASIKTTAPVAPCAVDLSKALNRALAEDVAAAGGQPAGPIALRDGYAVRAEDIMDAGSYAPAPLATAPVRVDVGGALPPGTDTVVPLDAIANRGGRFEAIAPAAVGDGVLPGSADLKAGDFIARAGWRLNDFNLAMLAMAGKQQIQAREPRIRLVKARAEADVVLDAIGDLLARALDARGCAVRRSAGDLAQALADTSHDAVIAIGGTGSGRSDASVETLAKHGCVTVHGVAISPGETAAFGGAPAAGADRCGDRRLAHHGIAADRPSGRQQRGFRPVVRFEAHAQGRVTHRPRGDRPGAPDEAWRRAHSLGLLAIGTAR